MTITLDLPEALEHQLREEAARSGMSLDRHIFQRLTDADKPPTEAELLQKIKQDLGLSPETWSRYDQLVRQRRAEKLTAYEYDELIALTDTVEAANVERIKYLIELAKLRGASLEQVMSDLGIRPRGFDFEDE
jgi:hypothetical protein